MSYSIGVRCENDPSDRQVLSRVGACQIHVCSCGTVHVAIGPVTVALVADALADVSLAAAAALTRLRQEEAKLFGAADEPLPPGRSGN